MIHEQVNMESEEIELKSEEDQMYRENILDYYKHPRNKQKLSHATIMHRELNPLCGDDITIYLHIENQKIIQATFLGSGCAISQASISMLTEKVVGKTLDDVKKLTKEDITAMLGITISPGRIKCALLSLKAVMKGIEEYESKK